MITRRERLAKLNANVGRALNDFGSPISSGMGDHLSEGQREQQDIRRLYYSGYLHNPRR